jgi:hypothetical protein
MFFSTASVLVTKRTKNLHSVEKEALNQKFSAILYFKQTERMLPYDRVIPTDEFL